MELMHRTSHAEWKHTMPSLDVSASQDMDMITKLETLQISLVRIF